MLKVRNSGFPFCSKALIALKPRTQPINEVAVFAVYVIISLSTKSVPELLNSFNSATGRVVAALSIDDVKKAKDLKNVEGIIVGKAIYDGDIKLEELVKEDA